MIDKLRKELNPLIGYPIQNQVCVPVDNMAYIHLYNQSVNGYNDFNATGLMTFKQFTLRQDDNLTPDELIEMYDSYKTKYIQKHQLEFLENNKNSPAILEKFHPMWVRKIFDERKNLVLKRIEIFSSKLKKGYFNSINKNDAEKTDDSNTNSDIQLCESDSITVFGNGPHFETDLRSHMLLLTDIPCYISYLDVMKFFNNDFPLIDGGIGKCNGFLDIFLSPPKFTRGVFNRHCYILFDNMGNRDSAIELMKGKTIKSSVTTNSIKQSYSEIEYLMEDMIDNEDLLMQQSDTKCSIYIIQAKCFNDNYYARVRQNSKFSTTNERLPVDKNNMKKIIEKIENQQGINSSINEILDNFLEIGTLSIKTVVDIMSLYLRFVHGIDYYSLSTSSIRNTLFSPSNTRSLECSSDVNNTKDLNTCEENLIQENNETSIKLDEKSIDMYNNLLFLSRGYINILFKNKFRSEYQRDENHVFEPQIHMGQLDDSQNLSLVNQLEENVDILLKLPSVFDLMPQPIVDDDESLSYSWKIFCEQHTLKKKVDRWQCSKCLKQFRGEEFVHKHLVRKHRDSLEIIREGITFERIIKPYAEKFPHLIYPSNDEELNVNYVRRGYNGNFQGPHRLRQNKHLRSNPYEKRRHFRDWDTPKQHVNSNSNDIRMSIKYDDL